MMKHPKCSRSLRHQPERKSAKTSLQRQNYECQGPQRTTFQATYRSVFFTMPNAICKPTAGSQRLPLSHRGYVPKSSGYLKLQTASGLKHHVFPYQWTGSTYTMDTLDQSMISVLVRMVQGFIMLLWMACNLERLRTVLFHLIFLDPSWPQVTETSESKTVG